jgi:hypothetical protein
MRWYGEDVPDVQSLADLFLARSQTRERQPATAARAAIDR